MNAHWPTVLELGMAVAFAYVGSFLLRAMAPKPGEGFGDVFFALLVFFGIGFAGRFLFGF
jgi:hypothetical protein